MTPKTIMIGNLYGAKMGSGFAGCVYNPSGIAPTLTCSNGGGQRQPFIMYEESEHDSRRTSGTEREI